MQGGTTLDIEELYSSGSDRIYAFAFRMLGDPEAALDVVQESFTVALAAAGKFRGEAAPLTWLMAIARNLCLRRTRRVRERTFEDFEALIEQHAQVPRSTMAEAERNFYVAEVKQGCLIGLLRCLPPSQRCVFVLHVLNDLSITEVASIVGKTPNAVRVLSSRARAGMRGFLCRNCGLQGGATCECANMIEFSLARHLIAPYRRLVDTDEVAAELRRFADEVELYRSLPNSTAAIAAALESTRFALFSARTKRIDSGGH